MNNLHLPFLSNMFDAVISIAVVHHFSTPEHRRQALLGTSLPFSDSSFYLQS